MKKQLWYGVLLTALLTCLVLCTATGESATTDPASFTVRNGVITDYSGTDAHVVIPAEIDGVEIVAVGDGAFQANDTVQTVVLPAGLKSIGEYAFSGCIKLETIDLPASLQSIGDHAFEASTKLKNIQIPEGIKVLGTETFSFCWSLQQVTLPESLETLETGVFEGCSELKTIELPDGLQSIAENVFPGGIVLYFGTSDIILNYVLENNLQYSCDAGEKIYETPGETFETADEVIAWVVKKYIKPGMSEYDKALVLYDWLCFHTAYDYQWLETGVATGEHGPWGVGALLDGWAVCDGYATAYWLLLQAVGIEVEHVTGYANNDNHAWNIAKIDGEWYQFDATWDEAGDGRSHNYFALCDDEMRRGHTQYTHIDKVCDAYKANYYYRQGKYDADIAALEAALTEKLRQGVYVGEIPYDDAGWVPQGRFVCALVMRDKTDWPVAGFMNVTAGKKGYTYAFDPTGVQVTDIQIKNYGADQEAYTQVLYPGDVVQIEATTVPAGNLVTYASSNENVATVSATGVVTALSPGSTWLTIASNNYQRMIELNVCGAHWVFGLELNIPLYPLDVGDEADCDILYMRDQIFLNPSPMIWITTDSSVLTINQQGRIRAVGGGTAQVGLQMGDRQFAMQTVTVREPGIGFDFDQPLYEAYVGETVITRIHALNPEQWRENLEKGNYWFSFSYEYVPPVMEMGSGRLQRNETNTAAVALWEVICLAPGTTPFSASFLADEKWKTVTTLIIHAAPERTLTLPASLSVIEAEAFVGCAAQEIVVPEGVTTIGARAFADCPELLLITLPNSLTELSADAFEGCAQNKLKVLCSMDSVGYTVAREAGLSVVVIP